LPSRRRWKTQKSRLDCSIESEKEAEQFSARRACDRRRASDPAKSRAASTPKRISTPKAYITHGPPWRLSDPPPLSVPPTFFRVDRNIGTENIGTECYRSKARPVTVLQGMVRGTLGKSRGCHAGRSCASLNAKYKTSPFYVLRSGSARVLPPPREDRLRVGLRLAPQIGGSKNVPRFSTSASRRVITKLVSIAGQYSRRVPCVDGVGLGENLYWPDAHRVAHKPPQENRVALFVPKAAGKTGFGKILDLKRQSLVNRFC